MQGNTIPDNKIQYFIFLIHKTKMIGELSQTLQREINPPLKFFPKRLGIFSPNVTCLLYVPIYARLQIFIQLPATLTNLCHIKRNHHNVLKMCTID